MTPAKLTSIPSSGFQLRRSKLLAYVALIAALLLVYGLFVLFFAKKSEALEAAGQFGDMFGGVSAIVNGIALCVLVYSLRQQTVAIEQQTQSIQQASASHVINTLDILHRRWTEPAMLRARLRASQRILQEGEDGKFSQSMQHIAEYFEHMGVLTRSNCIDPDTLWDLHSYYIEAYYRNLGKRIQKARELSKDPTAFKRFEELATSMTLLGKANGVPELAISLSDLKGFAESEIKLASRLLDPYAAQGNSERKEAHGSN